MSDFFFQNVFDNAFDSHCLSKIKIFEEKTLLVNGEKKKQVQSLSSIFMVQDCLMNILNYLFQDL